MPIAADLSDPDTLGDLPEVEYLFYTAAADKSSDEAYARAYVAGIENTLKALSGSELRHVFFVSSTGVYAQRAGEWVDENSETCPERFSGVRLLQGETAALDGPFPATVARFGGIYGPGRTRLVERVRSGTRCFVDPPRFTNRIHRDDCAGALRHLLVRPTDARGATRRRATKGPPWPHLRPRPHTDDVIPEERRSRLPSHPETHDRCVGSA